MNSKAMCVSVKQPTETVLLFVDDSVTLKPAGSAFFLVGFMIGSPLAACQNDFADGEPEINPNCSAAMFKGGAQL